MKPTPIVQPGTKHFPPHLTGSTRPVVVNEDEIRVAFDYLSQGKGFITKADLERVIKSLKPTAWSQYSDILGDTETITLEQLINQMKYYESGSFDCLKEAFNLFKGPRHDPLSQLVTGAPVAASFTSRGKFGEKGRQNSIKKDLGLNDGKGKKMEKLGDQQKSPDETDDEDDDEWLDDEEKQEKENKKIGLEEEDRMKEKERANEKENVANKGKKRKLDDQITEDDMVAIFKRAFPDEELDEEDIEFLMNAPDLNHNGRFDFADFSSLFSVYFEKGLPYGEPVLPEEWEFISGTKDDGADGSDEMAERKEEEEEGGEGGGASEGRFDSSSGSLSASATTATVPPLQQRSRPGTASSSALGSAKHRGNRMKAEYLQRKLSEDQTKREEAEKRKQQEKEDRRKMKEEMRKKGEAVSFDDSDSDLDIDPRYKDLPELFEKKLLEKQQRKAGGDSQFKSSSSLGGQHGMKGNLDADDWDEDEDDEMI
eukprot:MONOS_7018.1-p1 / transcript=MONOS_7018.1 / gene=MONOS_7018 / organism=Monocercomonoides_exilis_PA203 / gene_product=unspecified product / transcript_product=unspecified product / location=Mono_scaffold00231:42787-44503(+) / protein_length=483 / sequence_SO=supercontig / SO=protein_coding / is_pseudo=false